MKHVGDVYYIKPDNELPRFFKIKESTLKKVNGKSDYLLLVERYELQVNNIGLVDTYNMWYNYHIKDEMKKVTTEVIKAVKNKYKIKKGLHRIRPEEK